MLGLVLSAIGARRVQAAALLGLTILASAAAAAAPWYLTAASTAVATSDVASAPTGQRVYVATRGVSYGANTGQPLDTVRGQVADALPVPGIETSLGERIFGAVERDGARVDLTFAARESACERLVIEGSCPAAGTDVVISRPVADALGASVGDELTVKSFRIRGEPTVQVSGVYEFRDRQEPYWHSYSPLSGDTAQVGEPAFMTVDGLHALRPFTVDVDFHAILPAAAYLPGDGPDLGDLLARSDRQLRSANYQVVSEAGTLARLVRHDRRLVDLGVTVGTAQLLVLCWFALFLAVRHTVDERRPDIGLLKLRGASRWRVWRLTAEQSALPMVAGGVIGWGVGFLAALALAPPGATAGGVRELGLSAAAAGFACLGALLVAVFAEWRSLRTPVVGLLRRIPPRRHGWRAGAVDLAVAVLALVGVYQGYAEAGRDGEPSVLSLLAPGLVALTMGLLVAGALPWLAGRAGAHAIRAGRPGIALAALHLARRPGTNSVFALLVVAVAVLGTAVLAWTSSTRAWQERAAQELGAHRVLEVQAPGTAALLTAVRTTDPDGRYAMAVSRKLGSRVSDRILALDSTRLAAVAAWRPEYGTPDARLMAETLRPTVGPPVTIVDGELRVTASGPPVLLGYQLAGPAGGAILGQIGPLAPGVQSYGVPVTGCPPPAGCRLVGFELRALPEGGQPIGVDVHGVSQGGRELLGAADLGDPARWRPQVGPVGMGLTISARDGRLTLAVYPEMTVLPAGQLLDRHAYLVDSAVPLPVAVAGTAPPGVPLGDDRIGPFGGWQVPYRVALTADVLPRLGNAGLLVDLEYAQHAAFGRSESVVLEVWLNDSAPADVRDRLEAAGLTVVGDRSAAGEAGRLGRQGPGSALRFHLFAAAVAILLATGALVVTAAVERRPRVAELGAMRAQGVSRRSVRTAGYSGYAVLVAAAVLTGSAAAILAQVVVAAALPVFSDGWAVLPVARGAAPVPLAIAGAVATVAFVAALVVSARQVVRGANNPRPGGGA